MARTVDLLLVLTATVVPCGALSVLPTPGVAKPASIASIASRNRLQPSTMMMEDDKPPPEVIEAEAKAMPNRPVRLGVAVGAIGLSLLTGIIAGGNLANVQEAVNLRDLILFDNPVLTLAIDTVIGGISAWSIQQELETKEKNIQRIWEEVQRRRSGGAASGANRSQRRAKKVEAPKPMFTGGDGFSTPPSPPPSKKAPKPSPAPPTQPPPSAPAPPAAAPTDGGLAGGLFGKAKSFLDEANELGKTQALALNAQLEDKGVLPPIGAPPPAAPAAPAEEQDQAPTAAAAEAPSPAGVGGGAASRAAEEAAAAAKAAAEALAAAKAAEEAAAAAKATAEAAAAKAAEEAAAAAAIAAQEQAREQEQEQTQAQAQAQAASDAPSKGKAKPASKGNKGKKKKGGKKK